MSRPVCGMAIVGTQQEVRVGFFKQTIKAILKMFGLELRWIRHIPPTAAQEAAKQIVSSLRKFDIDLILDVGANKGQFASDIRHWGYVGRIVSFEPLSQAHAGLQQSSAGDPMWEAFPRCALGDHNGEVEINIAGNSESSSILPMLESHRSAAPESAYQGKETVPIKTLDNVAGQYIKDARAAFLKLDTQGFEWHVLDGARDALPHIKGILVELSLLQLYEGQHLWREVIDRLEAAGFTLWAFKPVFSDQTIGRTLQVDGIFFRNS
jgi:FkbM family methyltransferase